MNKKEKYIDGIMDSLDGVQRATPGLFFFTRVSARLLREQKSSWQVIARLVARPAIAISGLCLILLVNTWAVTHSAKTASRKGTELALVDEYVITSSNLYYYENSSEAK